jgi:hypothetical protein
MLAGYTVADPALLPNTKRSGNHSYYSFLLWRFPRGYRWEYWAPDPMDVR